MPLATMSQQAHVCWELKYWSPSTLLVCGHFIQIHSCMSICFSCMYTNNYKHFHKLGIPTDRVPMSKSCVFCLRIKFLFFPIWSFLGPLLLQGLFSWKGVMHVTLYEVSSESQFSDSVWWLYEPAQNEKIQTTLYITFCTLHGSGLCVLYSVGQKTW